MSDKILLINFTGTCFEENLPLETGGTVLDCSDIEGTTCYCDPEAEKKLADLIAPFPVRGLHWIDSGDYHYLSKLWLDRIDFPFNLLLLDNHPDMQEPAFGNILSCGGWLRSALEENPFVGEARVIGINPALEEECGGFGDRVKVICRDGLESPGKCLEGLSGLPLYISIDKDVLSDLYARTDWDQGTMDKAFLTGLLQEAGARFPILGADLCGELSGAKGGSSEDFLINRGINLEIMHLISRFLQ